MEAKKILIVEDDASLAGALLAKLEMEGFLAISAKNGEEGLEMALNNHPDLILLDIIMPKMNGIAMLKKLRTDQWGKDVPVVILSNLSEADKNIEVVDSNVQAYLIKSDWALQDVIDKIKLILTLV